jgi:hypothetical protein
MSNDEFLVALQQEAARYTDVVQSSNGDWIVKGFIDIHKNIYTISIDTKVVSKVLEILLFPELQKFATAYDMDLEPAKDQISYPDYTLIDRKSGQKFAIDIKTTFRNGKGKIKGMTLGTFQGYFRERDKKSTINYPYNEYNGHFVLGAIYSQSCDADKSGQVFKIDDLEKIKSVIKDFEFFAQYKYKIASGRPGSGNTKNIGSITDVDAIKNGMGPFSKLGISVFDDYWMFFQNRDMAAGNPRPYKDLDSYIEYKKKDSDIISKLAEEIKHLPVELKGEKEEPENENENENE